MQHTRKPRHEAKTTPSVALSPRQVALRKLYRTLLIGGGLAVLLTVGTIWPLYDRIFPRVDPRDKAAPRVPKLNTAASPGPVPDGMVWVPGGEFYMGVDPEKFEGPHEVMDAVDIHFVYVDGFWMDKTEVTNEQFGEFVKATGYVTDAEKTPTKDQFPDVPPENLSPEDLKPFSIVFKKPRAKVDLRNHLAWWSMEFGASWKHPEGKGSTIVNRPNFPVVHISYNDAVAYCKWAKKRLPTEAEWEFAARGGLDRKLYTWGDELKPEGKWMCNVWQGPFPYENTREDGFEGLAPVASFPPNGYGLYDMAGNAWEWCADWYQADYYTQSPEKNPQGPQSGLDWMEIGQQKRVQRGGSFLCCDNYCVRYVVGTRGKGEVTSAANHVGFRCARSAK